MKFDTFKSILTDIRVINEKNNKYIKSIPTDISGAVFDNEYTNNQYKIIDILFTNLLKDYIDDAEWFIYEFSPNLNRAIIIHDRKYVINTDDDFFNYMKKEAVFDQEDTTE